MEAWRRVWRVIAPLLPLDGLRALKKALAEDDIRLIQGATCTPPPLQAVLDWPVEAADAITFCYVVCNGGFNVPLTGPARSDGGCPVKDAEEFFARVCFEVDQPLGEPVGCRYWINFWDDTPRTELFALMIPEVIRAIRLGDARLKYGFAEDMPDEVILQDFLVEHPEGVAP